MITNQPIVEKRKQRGAALILFILIMMGFGTVAMTGLLSSNLSEIERNRFLHNERVLEEAKQALLMYAYNYPEFNTAYCDGEDPDGETTKAGCLAAPTTPGTWISNGPGRLPCPDHTNDGKIANDEDGTDCGLVGRFPWDEDRLDFHDARDAEHTFKG